jgi:hypothetical protein
MESWRKVHWLGTLCLTYNQKLHLAPMLYLMLLLNCPMYLLTSA